jgi:hypothetical protein
MGDDRSILKSPESVTTDTVGGHPSGLPWRRPLVYPSCVGVLTAIAYFSIVYCFTCMKTHIASEIESGEVVYKEKYRHLMIICGPRYVHQSLCF